MKNPDQKALTRKDNSGRDSRVIRRRRGRHCLLHRAVFFPLSRGGVIPTQWLSWVIVGLFKPHTRRWQQETVGVLRDWNLEAENTMAAFVLR